MKAKAMWEGRVIAETDNPIVVEGNYYFPEKDINFELLQKSELSTYCPWKGEASYYNVLVDGKVNKDAAWVYENPSHEAKRLKNSFAFWKGITIEKVRDEERTVVLGTRIKDFIRKATHINADQDLEKEFINLLSLFDSDSLIHCLPERFIENLSLFNFQNSNNPCFYANSSKKITYTNPTFGWAFNQMTQVEGQSLENLLSFFEILEGYDLKSVLEKLSSHGWIHLPKIRTMKNQQWEYFSLDVAIANHGEKESLKGFQGQFINITKEVELSLSLKESKANMKSLLAGLKEGLFFFDKHGNVASERSQSLSALLNGQDQFNTIYDFASTFSKVEKGSVEIVLDLLWPKEDATGFYSDFKTSVYMLPKKFTLETLEGSRLIEVEYRPLMDKENKLDKVIVIVDDVTDRIKNEKEARRQAERVKIITKAASNIESYRGFQEECNKIIHRLEAFFKNAPESQSGFKRDLHTLKGAFSAFNFNELSSFIHELEEHFVNSDQVSKESLTLWNNIALNWKQQIDDIANVLGLNQAMNEVMVQKPKISQIANYANALGDKDFIKIVNNLFERSPRIIFAKHIDYLKSLNAKFPQKKVRVEILNNSDELSYKEAHLLDGPFTHIFRNCFDHGIEEISERLANDKDEVGTIYIGAYHEGALTKFIIRDDGAGINGEKLAKKAVACGYWTEEDAKHASWSDKINLIFIANLSAKDEVSDISGRGIGMDAVKSSILDLNGEILVKSSPGSGTSFEIIVPTLRNFNELVA